MNLRPFRSDFCPARELNLPFFCFKCHMACYTPFSGTTPTSSPRRYRKRMDLPLITHEIQVLRARKSHCITIRRTVLQITVATCKSKRKAGRLLFPADQIARDEKGRRRCGITRSKCSEGFYRKTILDPEKNSVLSSIFRANARILDPAQGPTPNPTLAIRYIVSKGTHNICLQARRRCKCSPSWRYRSSFFIFTQKLV